MLKELVAQKTLEFLGYSVNLFQVENQLAAPCECLAAHGTLDAARLTMLVPVMMQHTCPKSVGFAAAWATDFVRLTIVWEPCKRSKHYSSLAK